jgi:hypothetical protein
MLSEPTLLLLYSYADSLRCLRYRNILRSFCFAKLSMLCLFLITMIY